MTKLCSQCKRGDIANEAEVLVTGRVDGRPYRANICLAHFGMLNDDGEAIVAVRFFGASKDALRLEAERIWENYERAKIARGMRPLSTAPLAEKSFYLSHDKRVRRLHDAYVKVADQLLALGEQY